MLDKKFFFKLAPNVVNMYRNHTFSKGLDVNGKKFKPYSIKYSKAKKSGKLKRQSSKFKNTTSPVLTGDLMRDFKVKKIKSDSFSFGTVTHGGKVEGLSKLGRNISTSSTPIPKKIQKFIIKEADDYFMKGMKKNFKDKKINLNL